MCVGRLTTVVKNEKQEKKNTTQSEQLQNQWTTLPELYRKCFCQL